MLLPMPRLAQARQARCSTITSTTSDRSRHRPGKASAAATADKPVGQSITLPRAPRVYRIGVRPVYDTWNAGETVTMASTIRNEKKRKLGDYSIGEATCHVDQCVLGNGSQFSGTGDRVLYFQFRKPTEGPEQVYFELSAAEETVRSHSRALTRTRMRASELRGCGGDLSFECHIKPVPTARPT